MPIYLLLVNVLGFAVMIMDKIFALNGLRRIPEKTLFGVAIIGGSFGCLLGMFTVRHKTRHRSFTVGIPVILAAQVLLLLLNDLKIIDLF